MATETILQTEPRARRLFSEKALTERFWRVTCLLLALGALWAVSIFCVYSFRNTWRANASAELTQNVRFETDRLLLLLRESEAYQRGYLLTGNDDFLEFYDHKVKLAPASVTHLAELTAHSPDQQARLDRLRPLIAKRLEMLANDIRNHPIKGVGSLEAATVIPGEATMEEIEKLAAAIIEKERQLYRITTDHGQAEAQLATAALSAGIAISTAVILLLFSLMSREIARRRVVESEIKGVNATLEDRVAIQTAELRSEIAVRQTREEELQNNSIFLDTVIESLPCLLVLKDAKDNRFVLLNRAGEELLGYKRSEYLGKNDYDFFPKEQADSFVARDHEVMHSGKAQIIAEEPITTRDKEIRLLRTTKVPILDKQGQPRYLLVFAEDITERKAIEQQLRQAVKMEAVGQLTGGIAHDFNNLLGIIIGNLDLVLEAKMDPKMNEMVQGALDGALRGAELVGRLLAFSRKQPLHPAIINLNDRLPHITAMLRRTLGEQIIVETRPGLELWKSYTDPSQIEEAILNLAINARDAMPRGGSLIVETTNARLDEDYAGRNVDVAPGDYVLLAVSDNGCGMSPAVIERVFEPFFTTKGVDKGTGLGLSMVYGFVKQSGGHIKIYSEPGHGTTVKIYLPRADGTEITEAQPKGTAPEAARGGELILVVEDNEGMRNVTLKQLHDLGYSTLEAENAKAALTILDRHPQIDLLFTDIVMPDGMTGIELAREASKRRPGLKILLTSGYTAHAMTNGYHDIEGLELLSKPFRKVDLAKKLKRLLDQEQSAG